MGTSATDCFSKTFQFVFASSPLYSFSSTNTELREGQAGLSKVYSASHSCCPRCREEELKPPVMLVLPGKTYTTVNPYNGTEAYYQPATGIIYGLWNTQGMDFKFCTFQFQACLDEIACIRPQSGMCIGYYNRSVGACKARDPFSLLPAFGRYSLLCGSVRNNNSVPTVFLHKERNCRTLLFISMILLCLK